MTATRIRDLAFSFGDNEVLIDVHLDIDEGDLVGIIGPSGAGKTTLLRILLGELRPTRGTIEGGTSGRVRIGYVPQLDAGERSFPLTVSEMVLLGGSALSRRRPWFGRDEVRDADAILDRLGILDLRDERLDRLSGGQFQRALIGRALMSRPTLLILDEPTSGIDLETRRRVLEIVEELRADGYTVILTTHDLNWVASHLPRIVCLNRTVIADGTPAEVLTPRVVRETYGAKMDVIMHAGRPVVVDAARPAETR